MSKFSLVALIFLLVGCSQPTPKEKGAQIFNNYCASCHLAPSIQDLPKEIWANNVLPEMGARLGIIDSGYDPYKNLTFVEKSTIQMEHIYPDEPVISKEDWALLKSYVLDLAPDSLKVNSPSITPSTLSQFSAEPISLDSIPGSFISFMQYDESSKKLNLGDVQGNVFAYDFDEIQVVPIGNFGNNIVDYIENNGIQYSTSIGQLRPSEVPSGRIFIKKGAKTVSLPQELHRPVHSLIADLNADGNDEMVVSEFGYLTGELSLFKKAEDGDYKKTVLLSQSGTNRVIAKDMNEDGKLDLIAQTAQSDEGISILYQQDNLEFKAEKIIRVSPLYGSSWFELVDYDGDGDDDIVTVNGDNADKSQVLKPYHGLRIYINDGQNNFKEKYFYAMNGATRLVARDFDKDSDIDFGIISTFPDYKNKPEQTFIYLENKDSRNYKFTPHIFKDSQLGKWFLMDAADVDNDGDEDIILSAFTPSFSKIPDSLSQLWYENNVDLMLLKNNIEK